VFQTMTALVSRLRQRVWTFSDVVSAADLASPSHPLDLKGFQQTSY